MFLDECSNLVSHCEQFRPLLFVERDGKPAEAIDRNAALLADLEADATATLALEALILRPEPFQFGFQIFVSHVRFLNSSDAARNVMEAWAAIVSRR